MLWSLKQKFAFLPPVSRYIHNVFFFFFAENDIELSSDDEIEAYERKGKSVDAYYRRVRREFAKDSDSSDYDEDNDISSDETTEKLWLLLLLVFNVKKLLHAFQKTYGFLINFTKFPYNDKQW